MTRLVWTIAVVAVVSGTWASADPPAAPTAVVRRARCSAPMLLPPGSMPRCSRAGL
jgi:hypothetical protein